jgi:hypothetical protein
MKSFFEVTVSGNLLVVKIPKNPQLTKRFEDTSRTLQYSPGGYGYCAIHLDNLATVLRDQGKYGEALRLKKGKGSAG